MVAACNSLRHSCARSGKFPSADKSPSAYGGARIHQAFLTCHMPMEHGMQLPGITRLDRADKFLDVKVCSGIRLCQ
jgi:hypothetical protein